MTNAKFNKDIHGTLVIDPYNDFISEGGKIWDRIKKVAEANNCVPNQTKALMGWRLTENYQCSKKSILAAAGSWVLLP